LVIEDIRAELRGRPYDLVAVAGGWHLRTREQFADAIHLAFGGPRLQPLSRTENLVLTAIAFFQPITRSELSQLFGKEVSRDIIGQWRTLNFIAAGPRGRPLYLCDHEAIPPALRLRYAARHARHGAARGRRAAQQTEAARRRERYRPDPSLKAVPFGCKSGVPIGMPIDNESRNGVGSRWGVGAGGRRIRFNCAGGDSLDRENKLGGIAGRSGKLERFLGHLDGLPAVNPPSFAILPVTDSGPFLVLTVVSLLLVAARIVGHCMGFKWR
jgi:hypothetical protein